MASNWTCPGVGPRIYGVTLRRPLTLGHVLLLAESDSPIVNGGTILPHDIALAVFICSMPADEARRDMSRRLFPLVMYFWGRLYGRTDHAAAIDAFVEWFASHAKGPSAWHKQGAGRTGGAAPWWINRIALAMGKLGMSYTEAVTMPANIVAQLTAAYCEAHGEAQYVTREQEEFFRMIKEREALERN